LLYDIWGAQSFHRSENTDPASVGNRARVEWTLEVDLEGSAGYFLYLMAHVASLPVPRHVIQTHEEEWKQAEILVCNGPFLLEAWHKDEKIYLKRNPDYFGGREGNLKSMTCVYARLLRTPSTGKRWQKCSCTVCLSLERVALSSLACRVIHRISA
jgi:ABC-type oligopeptide transport system substrate-binding subunit